MSEHIMPGQGWAVYASVMHRTVHVIPVDDLRPHDFKDDCWCGATPDYEHVVTHFSADRRELYENLPLQ